MPNAQCPMPNAQCPMPNAQCPMPNAQCPMPNAQCPMPNAQCPMLNAQYSINFFCKMLKIIASVEKGETESPNLKYVSKVFSHLH
ncbi:MAG: hypothetical protein V7L04_15080 [Nostoc sp.]|uniref:hypothetical protein n=1 Tax=Nostoc sp. TaxID=1180 RepID=UPI002FFD4907